MVCSIVLRRTRDFVFNHPSGGLLRGLCPRDGPEYDYKKWHYVTIQDQQCYRGDVNIIMASLWDNYGYHLPALLVLLCLEACHNGFSDNVVFGIESRQL